MLQAGSKVRLGTVTRLLRERDEAAGVDRILVPVGGAKVVAAARARAVRMLVRASRL
jgi:hypothetical protein